MQLNSPREPSRVGVGQLGRLRRRRRFSSVRRRRRSFLDGGGGGRAVVGVGQVARPPVVLACKEGK